MSHAYVQGFYSHHVRPDLKTQYRSPSETRSAVSRDTSASKRPCCDVFRQHWGSVRRSIRCQEVHHGNKQKHLTQVRALIESRPWSRSRGFPSDTSTTTVITRQNECKGGDRYWWADPTEAHGSLHLLTATEWQLYKMDLRYLLKLYLSLNFLPVTGFRAGTFKRKSSMGCLMSISNSWTTYLIISVCDTEDQRSGLFCWQSHVKPTLGF